MTILLRLVPKGGETTIILISFLVTDIRNLLKDTTVCFFNSTFLLAFFSKCEVMLLNYTLVLAKKMLKYWPYWPHNVSFFPLWNDLKTHCNNSSTHSMLSGSMLTSKSNNDGLTQIIFSLSSEGWTDFFYYVWSLCFTIDNAGQSCFYSVRHFPSWQSIYDIMMKLTVVETEVQLFWNYLACRKVFSKIEREPRKIMFKTSANHCILLLKFVPPKIIIFGTWLFISYSQYIFGF